MPNKKSTTSRTLLLTLAFLLLLPAAAGAAEPSPEAVRAETPSVSSIHKRMAHPPRPVPNEELLKLLKIDETTLHNELAAGKSLADVAASKGVAKQKVVDLLVSQHVKRLNEAVKAGQITEDEAGKWKSKMEERVRLLVDSKGGMHHRHFRGAKRLNDISQVLGMEPKALIEELKKGKSVVQIGKEKGISAETIESKLLEKEKARIHDQINRVWDKQRHINRS